MTDRYKGFVVTLTDDMRDDDAQHVIDAIKMIKHVANVEPMVSDMADYLARERARRELIDQLWDVLKS